MAYQYEEVRNFSKGTVTTVEDHAISRGAASRTRNIINVGDGFELVPGATRVGDATTGFSRVAGLCVAQDLDGEDHLFRVVGAKWQHFNSETEAWDDIKTDLTSNTDIGIFPFRTPAGSFVFATSQSDGPLRVNLENPTSYKDLYAAGTNYRGIMPIYMNRAYVAKRPDYETTLPVSWIDNDFPYTAVTNENIGTGDGATLTFTDTLVSQLIAANTVVVTAGAVTGTDDGRGTISGTGITGTINYTTGAIAVTFTVAPAGAVAIECDYSYETPDDEGIIDFTYTLAGRLAGEGDLVFQFEGSDPIQFVVYFKGVHYVFHTRSIWTVTFNEDDTAIENIVYRNNTGIPNWRCAKASNEGIYYVDQANDAKPVIRFLRYSEISDTTLPEEISVNVDLTGYDFDDGAIEEWGDFVLIAGKSPGAETNDVTLLYNTRWKTIDVMDGPWRCFARGQDKLYAGSSISGDVYELFTGYDIDDIDIIGEWEGKDDDLDVFELKKCKKFILETAMARTQKVRIEASFDEADFVTIGTIDGSTDYGQGETEGSEYGALLYGSLYAGSETSNLLRYLKEFRFGSYKFMRVKIRFVTYGSGYFRGKMYTFKDIRKKGFKLPPNFR